MAMFMIVPDFDDVVYQRKAAMSHGQRAELLEIDHSSRGKQYFALTKSVVHLCENCYKAPEFMDGER
ncbi:MAG: hypothetical protein DSM106950_27780 [Stigonema ocellatum SAG 48.90 = DSM 106950]|nr:hypothetical protein [Stigonema ocellatum SAG 48.90 = DSM 106950]